MPLPDFKDEAEFRAKWIEPFLQKLGYFLVTHTHGASEQGKDLIFADFDRFENIRYYAIQAKKGNIGAGDAEIEKLLNQVKRSFTVRIRSEKWGGEQRISSVYIFASGRISPEAREYIIDYCHAEHYGENVYFLDGDRLGQLGQFYSYQEDQERKLRLVGMLAEITMNTGMAIPNIKNGFTSSSRNTIVSRCHIQAISQALATFPVLDAKFVTDTVVTHEMLEQLNHLVEIWNQTIVAGAVVARKTLDGMIKAADEALECSIDLGDKVTAFLEELNVKYKADIEILEDTDGIA